MLDGNSNIDQEQFQKRAPGSKAHRRSHSHHHHQKDEFEDSMAKFLQSKEKMMNKKRTIDDQKSFKSNRSNGPKSHRHSHRHHHHHQHHKHSRNRSDKQAKTSDSSLQ
ncbi:hypothetical protein B5S27_g4942 [[Candida] boidinii]|nr:hypothetical protein B5S27_g4942 [[Candida] boidinii]